MTEHTMEELKALLEDQNKKLEAHGAKLTTVKGHVETILNKALNVPPAGLSAQQQDMLNQMVETARHATATIDAADKTLDETDAKTNPPVETTAAPVETPPAASAAAPETPPAAAPTEPPPPASPAPDGTAQSAENPVQSAPADGTTQQPTT